MPNNRVNYYNPLSFPSRYVCSVIDEALKCHKHRNYGHLPGLLEEIRVLASRMEAALDNKDNYDEALAKKAELKQEIDDLISEIKKRKAELDQLSQPGSGS